MNMTKDVTLVADLKFYVVRSNTGKYFRRKGYGGYGDSWVEDITKARVYAKLGGARTTVTYFATEHPGYPAPVIVELTATETAVLDETARFEKAKAKKERKKEDARIRYEQEQIRRAEHQIELAKAQLERLRK